MNSINCVISAVNHSILSPRNINKDRLVYLCDPFVVTEPVDSELGLGVVPGTKGGRVGCDTLFFK